VAAQQTLGAVLDRWVQFQCAYGRKPRTISTTVNCCERLKRFFGTDKPLEEIDSDALQAFVAWRQSNGKKLTGYTVNRDLAAIRAAWRHAYEDGKAPKPPKFRTLDTDEPNPKPVSREEFALLMVHADKRMRAVLCSPASLVFAIRRSGGCAGATSTSTPVGSGWTCCTRRTAANASFRYRRP